MPCDRRHGLPCGYRQCHLKMLSVSDISMFEKTLPNGHRQGKRTTPHLIRADKRVSLSFLRCEWDPIPASPPRRACTSLQHHARRRTITTIWRISGRRNASDARRRRRRLALEALPLASRCRASSSAVCVTKSSRGPKRLPFACRPLRRSLVTWSGSLAWRIGWPRQSRRHWSSLVPVASRGRSAHC